MTTGIVPPGELMNLLLIAFTKRAVELSADAPREQLELLQNLDRMSNLDFGRIPPEVVAAINPMGDTEMEMVCAARNLDPEDDPMHGLASYKVLVQSFAHFAALNPSLWAARDALARRPAVVAAAQ
jgi:hypothetical protein